MVNPTELIKLEIRSILIQISESCKKPSLTAAIKSLRVMTHMYWEIEMSVRLKQ